MDLGLNGKLAVVTGSTKGIGYAIASGFARHGATVVINGRSDATTQAAAAAIAKETGVPASRIIPVAGDLSVVAEFAAFTSRVDQIGLPVDILVNNHGIYSFHGFFEETDEQWQEFLHVNVLSQVRLTRHYLKGMLERKWGRVLFSSSVVGVVPEPTALGYSVSKTAQIALARGLAELTKGTEVTVNSVLIGPTTTEGTVAAYDGMVAATGVPKEKILEGFFSSLIPSYALNRELTPNEIADVFLFLASKQGLLINGTAQNASSSAIRHI